MPSNRSEKTVPPKNRKRSKHRADFQPLTDGVNGPILEEHSELAEYAGELDRLAVEVEETDPSQETPTLDELEALPWD